MSKNSGKYLWYKSKKNDNVIYTSYVKYKNSRSNASKYCNKYMDFYLL